MKLFVLSIYLLMNKIPEQNLHLSKKGSTVPCFLQKKPTTNTQPPETKMKKLACNSQEYEKLVISNPIAKNLYRKRANAYIKNTPKVIVVQQKNQPFKVYVQTPKKFLIENMKPYRKSVQMQKCIEIALTLFNIADAYGYFYCDKLMLKMSEDGSPVIWLHQRFKQNQREFPIKQSSVSELIFMKKLKQTLHEIVQFPKNIEVDTKKKMIAYLQNEKIKLERPPDQYPGILITKVLKNNISIRREASIANFSYRSPHHEIDEISSNKVYTPGKNMRFQGFYPQSNRQSLNKSNHNQKYESPRKMYDIFQKHKERIKTTNFQETQKIFQVNSTSNREKSEKLKRNISQVSQKDENAEKNSRKVALISPEKQNSNVRNQSRNKNDDSLKQDTICLQFNYDQEITNDLRIPKKNKSRKGSVDANIIMSWSQKQKLNEVIPFQHSTFSTSVTFSSLKAELENSCDQQDLKEKKAESKQENYVIPHLYSVDKQKQTKEKMNAGIKKIMKESEMKIAEEDSFENEVESLLDSCLIQEKMNSGITARQSLLITEFQKLFESNQKELEQHYSLAEDLKDLLQ